MADIQGTQGQILVTLRQATGEVEVFQGNSLVAYNVPAQAVGATYAGVEAAIRQTGDVVITQAITMAVVTGRVAAPELRVWTYTLDGHDYYVVRLGDFETIVYDVASEQWYQWGLNELPLLPVTTGINWLGGNSLAADYGSNVVVGDDSLSTIYILSPETIYDEDPFPDSTGSRKFDRVVQGQLILQGYDVVPCFGVTLYGDIGLADENLTVKLETSDNGGRSYKNRGVKTIVSGGYVQRVDWMSLGSMSQPGRLFKLTDDGAFARIDALELTEVPDGQS